METCPQFRRMFRIEHRLSSTAPYPAQNPFPAALFDALRGIQPEPILHLHWSAISSNTGAEVTSPHSSVRRLNFVVAMDRHGRHS